MKGNTQKTTRQQEVDGWDEHLLDFINSKQQRRNNVSKSSKTRQKKRNNRYAKEERLYGQ